MGLSTFRRSSLGYGWRALQQGSAVVRVRWTGTCSSGDAADTTDPPLAPSGEGGSSHSYKSGAALGVWEAERGVEMTPSTKMVDQQSGGKIARYLNEMAPELKLGKAFILTDVHQDFPLVALASLGPRAACYSRLEELDELRENIRWGVAAATRAVQGAGGVVTAIDLTPAPDAAAEGLTLADWSFRVAACAEGNRPADVGPAPRLLQAPAGEGVATEGDGGGNFSEGRVRAEAQNWARYLSDMPANMMTPVDLAQAALDMLCPLGVQVLAHDRDWISAQRMNAFLTVAKGSCEPPVFLECLYNGADPKQAPVLLSAKGITFDSGGLCLKKPESMVENRGSMAGAAVVLAALKALAQLKVKLNVVAVIPLCENMISGQCMKVGDVVCALNGKSIQIEHTDMEGRLMLADALVYGQARHHPELIVNVATLTHGVELATGGGAFGCFSNSEAAWRCVARCGAISGDRPWRLPLWRYYSRQITNDAAVDLRNKGSGRASPCLGAAFLQNFMCCDFVHFDITGVGKLAHAPAPPYLDPRRMTGRPTRTLVHFLQDVAKNCMKPVEPVIAPAPPVALQDAHEPAGCGCECPT